MPLFLFIIGIVIGAVVMRYYTELRMNDGKRLTESEYELMLSGNDLHNGEYIAFHCGRVVAVAPSYKELTTLLDQNYPEKTNVQILRVNPYEHPYVMYNIDERNDH